VTMETQDPQDLLDLLVVLESPGFLENKEKLEMTEKPAPLDLQGVLENGVSPECLAFQDLKDIEDSQDLTEQKDHLEVLGRREKMELLVLWDLLDLLDLLGSEENVEGMAPQDHLA